MSSADMATANVLAWGQVAGAIALVADGRYPRVIVANIAEAQRIAAALRLDAARCGVELVIDGAGGEAGRAVVVRRR